MAVRRMRRWIGLLVAAAVAALAVALLSDGERARDAEAAGAVYEALLSRAAGGDRDAQFALAERLRRGVGAAPDPARAAEWYRKAAERSHVGAQYALGVLHERGEGVARDDARAADWYRLAAALGGHAEAEFALAQLHYHGRGVAADAGEAVAWYRRAAEHGHPAAQHVLGTIYERGWNVEADLAEAYKWFTLAIPHRRRAMAVDRRFDPAAARAVLAARMTRFQIGRGERLAAAWQPQAAFPRPLARDGIVLTARPAGPAAETPRRLRAAVRLFVFEAPTAAGTGRTTLGLVVEFGAPAAAAEACRLTPRVREAVFRELWRRPVADGADAATLRAVEARLVAPLERVLGGGAVRRVHLYPGGRPLDANAILQTPFDAVEDCPIAAAGG